jgi:glycosyltransferase involved in cell wall biosynthesis
MPEYIRQYIKHERELIGTTKFSLLVISDTPMYKEGEQYVVLEATLREMEFLADQFSVITWIGFPYKQNNGLGRLPSKANIRLKQFPPAMGGKSAWQKLKILPYMPFILIQMGRAIRRHDVIHTRGPSVPALLAILSSWIWRRKYWHKYAGNWRQPVLPKAYAIQRYLLRRGSNFVAVNGRYPNDPPHIHTIENPCFSKEELKQSIAIAKEKTFTGNLIVLFVGRVEHKKGIFELLDAFRHVQDRMSLHVVGPGDSMEKAVSYANENSLPVHFYGAQQRDKLNELYAKAHVLILPSRAEGFPKVVAEGAGFGCIPICSDISSIGEYVKHGVNGFLIKEISESSISRQLQTLPEPGKLKEMSQQAIELATLFTYERYAEQIKAKLNID